MGFASARQAQVSAFRRRPRPGVAIALVSVLTSVGLWVLTWRAAVPTPQFRGLCQRLRDAGLAIGARDWFCQPPTSGARVAATAAVVLVALGVAFVCAVLAASGRRGTALVPLAALLTIDPVPAFLQTWVVPTFRAGSILRVATLVVLVAAPAVAVMWTTRGHRTRPDPVGSLAGAVVLVPVALTALGTAWAANAIVNHHFAGLGGSPFDRWQWLSAAVAIGAFGALLGTDRRWWPWSIAPATLLIGGAVSMTLVSTQVPTNLTFAGFGIVVPLALGGLVMSGWRPLVGFLVAQGWFMEEEPLEVKVEAGAETELPAHPSSRHRRWVVAANALAVGLIAVSLIAFAGDPLPAAIETSLPTYLGLRDQTQDVRARMDLRAAVDAALAYRASTGSFAGFDGRDGARSAPLLDWADGPLAPDGSDAPQLTMAVASASNAGARVLTLSPSGHVFCIEVNGRGSVTWGSGGSGRAAGPEQIRAAERRALGSCTSRPWSADAIATTPLACDGVDGGYLICRAVQAMLIQTLRHPRAS